MRSPLIALATLLVCVEFSVAQVEPHYASPVHDPTVPEWARLMYNANPDPGAVIEAYDTYFLTHTFRKNSHTQYFKRWMRGLSRELPPQKKDQPGVRGRSSNAPWQSIGPWDWDHGAIDRSYAAGAAHVYIVRQAPSNPDILYAGTATAGLWRSGDHGTTWQALTDNFRSPTVTALGISPLNPNLVFIELLQGVYKTPDGGAHWLETGDASFKALNLDIADIVFHPGDEDTIFIATQLGLYRTLNSGTDWVQLMAGDFQEIEFHPTQPDTIYTVKKQGDKTEFYRSVNGGNSFQLYTAGWPVPDTGQGEHQRRIEIAVTPDAPGNVYALATGSANGGSGLFGVYISEDAGETWTFACCGPQPAGPPSADNPNLMGWSDQGLDDGGQYYYDLAFAISPTNADSIFVAGVNFWISGNGGASFVCPAAWSHSYKPGYVHADIHDVQFYPGTNEIWLACDGGIFMSDDNAASFTRHMTGISGTDFWGFGAGFWDGEVMLGGTYHNGTLLKDNDVFVNGWISTDGGDNYRGFVNPGKPKQVYSDYNIKSLSGDRMTNSATRNYNNKPNASYTIGRSSDILFHPQYYQTWVSGSGTKLWKTEDDGFTFTMLHDFGVNIAAMDIAWSDPDVLYVCTWPDWWGVKRIYRSEDGGVSWGEITPGESLLNGNIWVPYDIAVDAGNPDRVWIVRTSMYANTNLNGVSVFLSENGGQTWQSWATPTLDGEAFTCIMHQGGTNGGVYLGTRETVYYRNAAMSDWEWFGDGLPEATFATRLVPYYREAKLRSGTNRSVWEAPFYETFSPIAQPSVASRQQNCVADTVQFIDHSIMEEDGASWLWEFPGGTPSTSTGRNPRVVYTETGIYDVNLTVSDINGSDEFHAENMVEVRDWCGLDTVPGRALKCNNFPDYAVTPNLGLTTNTVTISAWVKPTGIQSNYAAVIMNDGTACGLNFRESNNTLGYHWAGNGAAWTWDSNLEVSPDEWSHVAIVVSPSDVTLYVNGIAAVHAIIHPAVSLGTFRIGNYQGWQARNFKGLIDEVCIWNRSLAQDEIRALRHLTKDPTEDPDLVLYYQFNEETTLIYDKAQDLDGNLNGGAIKVRSRAPLGSGVSQSLTINSPGEYEFQEAGLTVSFPGTVPEGEVYATRLNVMPDTLVGGQVAYNQGYWILNNYGANQVVSTPDSIVFDSIAFVSQMMGDSLGAKMYFRGQNDEVSEWEDITTDMGEVEPGEFGSLTFRALSANFEQLGQFYVSRDSSGYGRPLTAVVHPSDTSMMKRGGSSAALAIESQFKGLLLPQYSSASIQDVPSPAPGSVAFLSDAKVIVCFDGMIWQYMRADYLEPPEYSGFPENSGMSLGGAVTSSAMLGLGQEEGLLVLPGFEADDLMQMTYPGAGLLIYRDDLHLLSFYDGVDWKSIQRTGVALPASSEEPTVSVPGILIGEGAKDPNALLEIRNEARGLALPVAKCQDVLSPQAGLLIFDPEMHNLVLFDGVGWKLVR